MADWMPPSPIPQTLFSSMLGDNFGSKATSESTCEVESGFSFHRSEQQLDSTIPNYREQQTHLALSDQQANSRASLLERMAARAGFNAPRLDTETIRPSDISQMQGNPSPYFTVPLGLSPTSLLESPVFVSNSLAQPSPTTGQFSFFPSGSSGNSGLLTESVDKSKGAFFGSMGASSFAFTPIQESVPSHFFGSSDRASFPNIEVSVQSANTMLPQIMEQPEASVLNQQSDLCTLSAEKDTGGSNMPEQRTYQTVSAGMEHSSPLDECQDDEADQRGDVDGDGPPAEDGYNWRKYGQKQVKGSDYPRSYYKCTHLNCAVKKKVERSQEGHITEIIYKGAHNHPKDPTNCQSAFGSTGGFTDMQQENGEQAFTGANGDPVWTNVQRGNMAFEWGQDGLEVTSSTKLGAEYGGGASSVHVQSSSQLESGDAADGSSTFSNDEDEDDDERATHGSVSVAYDGEVDEPGSKKRKVEAYAADISGATRAIREPRVVVQTTSEVDILDDGYRWRKYGQKVVKGNPNPRSYYKCTSAGCSVRKHVERASHDLKSVITTYEGKHNHDVPAARNSSHGNSGVRGNAPTAAHGHLHRPEPHNSMGQYDRTASPGSFGLATRPHLIPPNDFGYTMNQRAMPQLSFGGWGPNQVKLPAGPVNQYMGQPRTLNEMDLMLSKGQPKAEPMSESGLSLPNASSVYQQVMSRLPLGPQM